MSVGRAPDAEDFVVCAMATVMRSAVERESDDVLPFCVVTRIAGAEDPHQGTDDPVVQLEFFGRGAAAAKMAAIDGNDRMKRLATDFVDVTMSDGATANANSVTITMAPVRMPYKDDTIVRYVGRYTIGLNYVAVNDLT